MPPRRTPASIAGPDAAERADAVDRAQMVHVAFFDRERAVEIDAERRAEELRLDVVHRERIAREERVDEAVADQLGEIVPGAGVHDRGAADEQHALSGAAHAEQFARDLGDQRLLGLLARHRAGHELEDRAFARRARHVHAHPAVSDDDRGRRA